MAQELGEASDIGPIIGPIMGPKCPRIDYYRQTRYSLSVSVPEPSSVIWGAFFVPKLAIILFWKIEYFDVK